MNLKTPLVLDLDFTLIHLEYVPGSIEVPGRTRSAWLAPQTVAALGELQDKFEIVLATARSWDGARWVADGLNGRGVEVRNVVIEDGARLGAIGALRALDADFDAAYLREVLSDGAAFEWQLDFESCAVARCQTPELASERLPRFESAIAAHGWGARAFRDGRKVYVLPGRADKWSALQRLLGARAEQAAGVGDGENDAVWLSQIAHPATFSDAHPDVIKAVRARNGWVGGARGHQAIRDVLRVL